MLFIYALAAVVSLAVAWGIKLVFAGIQMQKARAMARAGSPDDVSPDKTD
jgi:hypothetical protein